MAHLNVCGCILLTVYAQLIMKWRVSAFSPMPDSIAEKVWFFARLLMDPFVISGFAAAFGAAILWMAVMTKFEVSFAYPVMSSLAFALVLLFSVMFLGESFSLGKIAGLGLIVAGLFVMVRL